MRKSKMKMEMRKKENKSLPVRRKRSCAQASFTVEAALLMAVILPVLIALLITGFYLHDRAFLQEVTTELCAMQSNLRMYEDSASRTERVRQHRLAHTALWAGDLNGECRSSKEQAAADMTGTFTLPGIIGALLSSQSGIHAHWERRLYDPAPLIRNARAAKYLLDDLAS